MQQSFKSTSKEYNIKRISGFLARVFSAPTIPSLACKPWVPRKRKSPQVIKTKSSIGPEIQAIAFCQTIKAIIAT